MNSITRFTTKVERYARYRWDYAPEAIQGIFDITGLSSDAIVADIGAGTGLLTKELVGRVRLVVAIEPNPEMRQVTERLFGQNPMFISMGSTAEATHLPDRSVDLITVGQALHWFKPEASLTEFQRILKPDGWLAAIFHSHIDQDVSEALSAIYNVENGWDTTPSPKPKYGKSHTDTYYDVDNVTMRTFPQTWSENWETFLGGILSDSHSPDDTHPAFPRLVTAVRQVFDHFSKDGYIQIHGGTVLYVGKLRKDMPR